MRPLLKKSNLDPENLKNYRPVSNLSFLSKILEKIVLSQINVHLTENGLQEVFQSAYKAKHSTETALLKVTSDLLCSTDRGEVSVLALLDLSAAFDTLDHEILLKRMSTTYGIHGTVLKWFASYISNRHQRVAINGYQSDPLHLKFGVPQGSVLGPVLFSMYAQPVSEVIQEHDFNYHLYADDTQLYKSIQLSDLEPLKSSLDACVTEVSKWMSTNKLKFNEDKTEIMMVGTPARVKTIDMKYIDLCGDSIPTSKCVKNLGVTLDSTLTMDKHISQLRKACYFELRRIAQIRSYLSIESANRLVCSLITSKLDYCNSLFAGITDTQINKIQQVQNNAARLVTKTHKREHITPVLKHLHWLPIRHRIEYKIATTAYQCLYEQSYPQYLKI